MFDCSYNLVMVMLQNFYKWKQICLAFPAVSFQSHCFALHCTIHVFRLYYSDQPWRISCSLIIDFSTMGNFGMVLNASSEYIMTITRHFKVRLLIRLNYGFRDRYHMDANGFNASAALKKIPTQIHLNFSN